MHDDSYEWLTAYEQTSRFENTIPIDALGDILRSDPLAVLATTYADTALRFLQQHRGAPDSRS